MKEIHFYECAADIIPEGRPYRVDWYDTATLGEAGVPYIITTQMGLLSTLWLEKGYRVFVHAKGESSFEIKIGENKCTNREIRPGHNLFRMWMNGEFDPVLKHERMIR